VSERVAVTRVAPARYPATAPYDPSCVYPERPFDTISISREWNGVYDAVRRLLHGLGLDVERYGTPEWNPLGQLLQPGMTVVLKPNFVASRHPTDGELYAVITHPSVIRAVADYCWIALRGHGRIVIADAPQYDCNWRELMEATGLERVDELYGGHMELLDLRPYWSAKRHFASQLQPLPGDPLGTVWVDMAGDSAFAGMDASRMVGACYWRHELAYHHTGGRHQYALSRTVLEADLVISMPKLKTHKKVGVTLNAKNLVGICTDKNCLPHYRLGSPGEGGDQYPDGLLNPVERALIGLERWMYDHLLAPRVRGLEYLHRAMYWLHNHTTRRLGLKVDEDKRALDAGNWYGNDTAWRTVADLYAAFSYALRGRTFSVVDGIVGGEGNGPLAPDAVRTGLLVAGEDLLAVDIVSAWLMGFDARRLPLYRHLYDASGWDWSVAGQAQRREFAAHPGWVGHMEAPKCA